MKKFLLFAGAVAAGLTSCTSDEVMDLDTARDAITFRTAMALEDVTRGEETMSSNIQSFKMTAIDFSQLQYAGDCTLFNQLEFTRGAGDVFKSTPEYMWYKDADLTFYAYSYYSQNGGGIDDSKVSDDIEITPFQATINNFYTQPKIKDQIDLVATTTKATYDDGRGAPLSLVFDHILTEVHVAAKSDNEVYDFKVKGVKFCNIVGKGNFDFTKMGTGERIWTPDESVKRDFEVRYDEPITLGSAVQDISDIRNSGFAILIPQTLRTWSPTIDKKNTGKGTYIAVLLQITKKDSDLQVFPLNNPGKYAWACIPIYNEWQPGHRLRYVLDFTKGAGYTDPNPDPDPKDPDDPGKPDPDLPGPDDPDLPDPGYPILDGKVQYTVSVNPWSNDPDVTHTLDFTHGM